MQPLDYRVKTTVTKKDILKGKNHLNDYKFMELKMDFIKSDLCSPPPYINFRLKDKLLAC
jgi:hypothetical protein